MICESRKSRQEISGAPPSLADSLLDNPNKASTGYPCCVITSLPNMYLYATAALSMFTLQVGSYISSLYTVHAQREVSPAERARPLS